MHFFKDVFLKTLNLIMVMMAFGNVYSMEKNNEIEDTAVLDKEAFLYTINTVLFNKEFKYENDEKILFTSKNTFLIYDIQSTYEANVLLKKINDKCIKIIDLLILRRNSDGISFCFFSSLEDMVQKKNLNHDEKFMRCNKMLNFDLNSIFDNTVNKWHLFEGEISSQLREDGLNNIAIDLSLDKYQKQIKNFIIDGCLSFRLFFANMGSVEQMFKKQQLLSNAICINAIKKLAVVVDFYNIQYENIEQISFLNNVGMFWVQDLLYKNHKEPFNIIRDFLLKHTLKDVLKMILDSLPTESDRFNKIIKQSDNILNVASYVLPVASELFNPDLQALKNHLMKSNQFLKRLNTITKFIDLCKKLADSNKKKNVCISLHNENQSMVPEFVQSSLLENDFNKNLKTKCLEWLKKNKEEFTITIFYNIANGKELLEQFNIDSKNIQNYSKDDIFGRLELKIKTEDDVNQIFNTENAQIENLFTAGMEAFNKQQALQKQFKNKKKKQKRQKIAKGALIAAENKEKAKNEEQAKNEISSVLNDVIGKIEQAFIQNFKKIIIEQKEKKKVNNSDQKEKTYVDYNKEKQQEKITKLNNNIQLQQKEEQSIQQKQKSYKVHIMTKDNLEDFCEKIKKQNCYESEDNTELLAMWINQYGLPVDKKFKCNTSGEVFEYKINDKERLLYTVINNNVVILACGDFHGQYKPLAKKIKHICGKNLEVLFKK